MAWPKVLDERKKTKTRQASGILTIISIFHWHLWVKYFPLEANMIIPSVCHISQWQGKAQNTGIFNEACQEASSGGMRGGQMLGLVITPSLHTLISEKAAISWFTEGAFDVGARIAAELGWKAHVCFKQAPKLCLQEIIFNTKWTPPSWLCKV